MQKKKIFVSVTNDLSTDQRVAKVCEFLFANGYEVTLIGRKLINSLPINDRPYKIKRFKLFFTKGVLFYASYNLRLFFYLLFKRFDVLLSNDLDTLLANYLAYKIHGKSELVYDSHELFTEVPELTSRPAIRKVWLTLEKWIFPKLDTVITVNQSIADIYKERYKKNLYIVRNISKRWSPKNILSKEELGIPTNKFIIILQGSGINVDRGGEEAVLAMKWVDEALFLVVGSGDVVPRLKEITKENQLEEKVRFIGRLPYMEMMNYTLHADIGLSLDKDTNPNYQFSLPNKLFDYIHSSTPVVSSNLIELRRVIEKYDVGRVIPEHSPVGIANTINALLKDEQTLNQLKENCKIAANEENWEKESEVLKKIYL